MKMMFPIPIVNDISESMSEFSNEASQKEGYAQMNKVDRDYDHDKWEHYKRKYGKFYANETDENEHMMAFLNNLHYLIKHNKLYQDGKVSFKLGINHLSDLLPHEYKKLSGFRYDPNPLRNCTKFREPMNVGDLPESVDWRSKGFVTPVKNQGMCGSCWAFSATGALEGQHKYATGELVSLSEQNLIDCSSGFGNEGCGGGFMDSAFQYVKANKGIDTEASYPYKADDEKCHFKAKDVGATDMGCVDIPVNEDILKIAVATQGPISVAIDAGHESFHNYKKGIYYKADCSPRDLDHGVLVVGYGTDPKHGDYWIVKNSWSTKWGMDGYILMSRNKNNNCGIATAASYPLV